MNRIVRAWLIAPCAVCSLGFTFLDPVAQKAEEGNVLYGEGRFAEALSKYREAQVDRPEERGLRYNVGDALYREEDYDEAIASFAQAAESEDAALAASAYHNLGNSHFRKKDFQSAIDAYEKALTLNPDQVDTKINLELANDMLDEQGQQDQDEGESGENDDDQQQDSEERTGEDEQPPEDRSDESNPGEQEGKQPPQPESRVDDEQQNRQSEDGRTSAEGQLSPEEAERLLDAMKDREADAQKRRKVRLVGPRYRGKAW